MKRLLFALVIVASVVLGMRWVHHQRASRSIEGLWIVGTPRAIDDELRFYYFHDGGHGLYRYGKVGYNQTSSFDWSVSGNVVTLTFGKTGSVAKSRFTITNDELVFADDPRGKTGSRYKKRPVNLDEDGPLTLDPSTQDGAGFTRMWVAPRKLAKGGFDFRIYQLSDHRFGHDAGSAKLGWFHAGDSDDWTTETLVYRLEPSQLQLRFLLRNEPATTGMKIEAGKEHRQLTIEQDPRDFGERTRFFDGGPSF